VHRRIAALAVLVFLASLVVAAAAPGAGPSYVSLGGLGALASDGKTRYVAVSGTSETVIQRVRVSDGSILAWDTLDGIWGIPAPTASPTGGEGVTRNGKRLVVASAGGGWPTKFAILDARSMRTLDRFDLDGSFAYDALSPDGTKLYLVQHVDQNDEQRYVVRAYDLRSHRLLPGRIADKTQRGWVMEGWAVARTSSTDGRWVYTLYQRGGGYPFIHALDTVNAVAHCIGLPWKGDQTALANMRLTLGPDGRTLAVRWKSGRPWLTMNTADWQLAHVQPTGFPWRWAAVAAAAAILLVLAAGLVVLGRRRQTSEAAPVPL
jgi:hypothetical protein